MDRMVRSVDCICHTYEWEIVKNLSNPFDVWSVGK